MKALTENPLERFFFTLRFFTRLRVPVQGGHDGNLAENAILFPLVGLFIGGLIGVVWWFASQILPPAIAAGLVIGTGLLLTGGLHEDGFADCADGLGGAMTREKALDIMRDSRVGAYGAMALVLTIGLRWAALAALAPAYGVLALLVAHSGSRALIALPLAASRYARPQGLADSVSDGITKRDLLFVLALATVISLVAAGWAGLVALSVAVSAAWGFLKYMESRLGGYTGDGLGAVQQIGEITLLITLAGFWS